LQIKSFLIIKIQKNTTVYLVIPQQSEGMERVYNAISSSVFPFPLFIMGKGRLDALSEYKLSRNGVLFASDSCGEGIDIAGDTLSNLIIVKLPFAAPDPINEYEQSIMGGLDTYLANINTPNMIIKLKQYAGRLTRTETDTGLRRLLETVRELKALGIDSFFKKENIHSISEDGELFLTILASFA